MFIKTIVLCCLFAAISATNVQRCTKGQPFPLSVEVQGCTEPPCDVIKGQNAIMDVNFVGTQDNLKQLTTKIRATAFGFITVPYDLPEDIANVCGNLLDGASCPINKDEDAVYRLNFPVGSAYPEIQVKVEVSIVDQDDQAVSCFLVNIQVKK